MTHDDVFDSNFPLEGDTLRIRDALLLSPYAKRLIQSNAQLLDELILNFRKPWQAKEMQSFIAASQISDEATLKSSLRRLRQRVMLRMLIRDLSRISNLQEVMATMTALAEVSISTALTFLQSWHAKQYGQALDSAGYPQKLVVVGMGKLGGGELNASSDIDLIFAYPEDGVCVGVANPLSHNEYFNRLGKKLIAIIDEITAEGQVFRVDMMLRPFGSEGAIASSYASLEAYYQTQGREWERYAWIKGRVIYPAECANDLYQLLKPFVFRKYFDFGAFASMRDLKSQIVREVARREWQNNIKLGAGGIREIEFIAQVFQLIRGGRDVQLQIRPTLAVLEILASQRLLSESNAKELSQAYVFLRNLEHRLQYQQDAQTHDLPNDEETRRRVATAMNVADWDELARQIESTRQMVSGCFNEVFAFTLTESKPRDIWDEIWMGLMEEESAISHLKTHGYEDAEVVIGQIRALRESSKLKHLPASSRDRFNALMPHVIKLSAGSGNPNHTLLRMMHLLESVCRRASYLAFFAEYPHVLERVVKLVSASPWLANYLSQHPILLDELLDVQPFSEPDFTASELKLDALMKSLEGDTERQMDAMRHFQQARLFNLATEDVVNHLPLQTLSSYLSDLADMILRSVLKTVWPTIKGHHLDVPKFAIIAYGKHGGRELGYSSDLDMVFLYSDDHPDAADVYRRFGLRIIAWLNTMTSAGILYETDLQLRPDGGSGLLVCSMESFANYHREKAWTWEHQAITRARFSAGDAEIGAVFEAIRTEILMRPRNLTELRNEISQMRKRMNASHTYVKGRFDLKHGLGGMIDVEFIVQYLVLAYAHNNPKLCENRANIHILRLASALSLIPPELGELVADAYRTLRQSQHALRLQGYVDAWVPEESMSKQTTLIRTLWKKVFYELDD